MVTEKEKKVSNGRQPPSPREACSVEHLLPPFDCCQKADQGFCLAISGCSSFSISVVQCRSKVPTELDCYPPFGHLLGWISGKKCVNRHPEHKLLHHPHTWILDGHFSPSQPEKVISGRTKCHYVTTTNPFEAGVRLLTWRGN